MFRQTVSQTIKRFQGVCHNGYRLGRGRYGTNNTSAKLKASKKRINWYSPQSIRKISREIIINRESVQLMENQDLELTPNKLHKDKKICGYKEAINDATIP